MTKDTRIIGKVCRSELIVRCDKAAIEAAWQATKGTIEMTEFFSYTLEALDAGRTKIKLWPFVINTDDPNYISMDMLDLPDADHFIEKVFLPFKKSKLKKLCVLCLTRINSQAPLRVCLMVDSRAGKDKTKILKKAFNFCTHRFREAYISADIRSFSPARVMDEISMNLAELLL